MGLFLTDAFDLRRVPRTKLGSMLSVILDAHLAGEIERRIEVQLAKSLELVSAVYRTWQCNFNLMCLPVGEQTQLPDDSASWAARYGWLPKASGIVSSFLGLRTIERAF